MGEAGPCDGGDGTCAVGKYDCRFGEVGLVGMARLPDCRDEVPLSAVEVVLTERAPVLTSEASSSDSEPSDADGIMG